MDDTQTQQATPTDPMQSAAQPDAANMGDIASMTPPPAPVMPEATAPAEPAAPTMDMPTDPMPAKAEGASDDYASAEDILNEILDSLDRIEAKLDAMEKKMG